MRYTTRTLLPILGLALCLAVDLCGARALAASTEEEPLAVLTSNADVADKCNACRELRTVGTENSIPALAALLTEPDIAHAARIALEAMPYPAAGDALRDAVGKTTGLTKSGIIDSLGERRDVEAVTILAAALQDQDSHVRAAAATALGKIASPESAAALAIAYGEAQGDDRTLVGQALVLCADRLDATGKRAEAAAIYEDLSLPGAAPAVRMAALRGRLQTAGPKDVAEALADDDPLVRQAAAGQLKNLPDGALRDLAAGMSSLPAGGQVALLGAIRARRDKSLAPVVLQAAGSADPAVRIAAIRALGMVGNAAALELLVEASAGDDAVGNAARQSLEIICDPQVDEQIISLLRAERAPAQRAAWIGLVEARRPAGAVALLLEEAKQDSSEVRSRAMAALANLAGPKDVFAMASAVLHAEKGAERDNAEKAVMLVCQQVADADKRAEPVLEVFKTANSTEKAALLPLLGRIGGSEAKEVIQAALDSGDGEMREAGLRGLCNWPDASVAGQLLGLSEKAKAASHRLWALRAFIRVIALPNDMPDDEKLGMLKHAIERAERDEERNLVLERASAVRTVEALRFLQSYLDQPSLAQTAGSSITELGRHKELREPNKSEFISALRKVIETNQDHATLERARRYLQEAQEGGS